MKKHFALISAAALLLVGCAKEVAPVVEEDGAVTFSVALSEVTKAVKDNDGFGKNVDNIKVAVWMHTGDAATPYKLYDTPEVEFTAPTASSEARGTFTVNLIKSQTYQIVVWADKYGMYTCSEGLDKITRKSNYALLCNSDELDAFYASVEYTQGVSEASVRNIVAKRPFAQLNIITNDIKAGFEPTDVTVKYTADTEFYPISGTCGNPQELTYAYDEPHYRTATTGNNTLVMNYLFAAEETAVLSDVVMTAQVITTIEDVFNNIPVQRNYRTNIIGALLTNPEDFTVVVDPVWSGETQVDIVPVGSVADANAKMADGETHVTISNPVDAAETPVTFPAASEGQDMSVTVSGNPGTLYFNNAAGTQGPATLSITAPAGTALVINCPATHVTLNGAAYGNVTAATSANTLVVAENASVAKLIIKEGGISILGSVAELALDIAEGKTFNAQECHGLTQAQYDLLKDNLAEGFSPIFEGGKWNIERVVVATVNSVEYYTIPSAIAAVTKELPLVLTANETVAEYAWPAATPVYAGGEFYASLAAAVAAGQTAVYCRPEATLAMAANVTPAAELVVYGNNAALAANALVVAGANLSVYYLKNVSLQASASASADALVENCAVKSIALEGAGLVNLTVKACSVAEGVASQLAGQVTVDGCSLAAGVKFFNKAASEAQSVLVKGCTFTDCATPVSVASEKVASNIKIDRCVFNYAAAHEAADVVIGEPVAAVAANGLITYHFERTNAKYTVYSVHAAGTVPSEDTATITSDKTQDGVNEAPYYMAEDGIFHIVNKSGFIMFRNNNLNQFSFYNRTIVLDKDIDFGGDELEPSAGFGSGDWKCVIDGQNHTLKNIVIDAKGGSDAALFKSLSGTLKNLKVDNITVKNVVKRGAALVAKPGALTFENCHISNAHIQATGYKNGVFSGMCYAGTTYINCSVTNSDVSGTRMLGGFVGSAGSGDAGFTKLSGNKVTNLTITCSDANNAKSKTYGAFVGSYFSEQYKPQVDEANPNQILGTNSIYDANEGLGILNME